MALRDYLPSFRGPAVPPPVEEKKAQIIDAEDKKALAKAFKISALALGYEGLPSNLSQRANFEDAPYDFARITQAINTDSYAKSAYAKFRELFWKEGWSIVGENPEAVDYIYQRIDYMEVSMNRPFQGFLDDVVDQLARYHNVFIAKSRSDQIDDAFPDDLEAQNSVKGPVIGYYIIPTEQVQILRDKYNRPKYYRQRITSDMGVLGGLSQSNQKRIAPTWKASEVIHLYRDKAPGRAFGTPFLTSGIDDILALRQVEEDFQNLIHRELFPLYKYIIGTEEHPAEPDEIEKAVLELENLRTEGGLVLPFRHDIEIIGSEGKTLEISPFLNHMKERVAVGLGVFPHHLGMVSFPGNKDLTDRLDVALYDRVKEYQRSFAESFRMYILDELLREGGFDPMPSPKHAGSQDRCTMKFAEIDVDTQVKKESHTLQKVTANLESIPEGRMAIGKPPELHDADTMSALQQRLTPTVQTVPGAKTATGGTKPAKVIDTTPAAAQNPSTGGKPNQPNLKKGASNIVRPRNQHGARTSPNIRHSDDGWLSEMVDLIGDDFTQQEDE